jgi:hypothetical protein
MKDHGLVGEAGLEAEVMSFPTRHLIELELPIASTQPSLLVLLLILSSSTISNVALSATLIEVVHYRTAQYC